MSDAYSQISRVLPPHSSMLAVRLADQGLLTAGKLPSVPARTLGPFGELEHHSKNPGRIRRWLAETAGDAIGVISIFAILFFGLFLAGVS